MRATSDRKRVSEDVADVHSDTLIPRCHSSTPLPVPAKPHQGVAPSIGRLRVLLSRAQLEIWAFVTPDVTPSAFQKNMERVKGNRTLVISLEGFCSIRTRSAASAGRSLACRRPATPPETRDVDTTLDGALRARHAQPLRLLCLKVFEHRQSRVGVGTEIASAPRRCRRARKDNGGRIAFSNRAGARTCTFLSAQAAIPLWGDWWEHPVFST